MTSKITFRPIRDTDVNFILATWLKTYKYSGDLPARVRDSEYFSTYEPILKELLSRATVTVACLIDDPDVVIGYVCYEPEMLHWVHVKESWRNLGLAKLLVVKSGVSETARFTHWTQPMKSIVNKYPTFIFNPWGIYGRT